MKYMITEYESHGGTFKNVLVRVREDFSTQFPAILGNPNYDAFLVQVELTDEQVHTLPTNEWFQV